MSKQIAKANNSFVCSFCEQFFGSNEELMLHMQCHNVAKPFFCTECDNNYAYKAALNIHMDCHRQENLTYNCNECSYSCDNKRNLINHLNAHSSDKIFACKNCDYKTTSKWSLYKHCKEHGHGNKYKCKDCELEFPFMNSLIKHANEIHKNKEPLACSTCLKLFSNKSNLTRHTKIHATNDIISNKANEKYSDNESEVIIKFHTENDQCDQNNNIEQIIPDTLISNDNIHHVDKFQNNCVSCKKKI